MSVPLYHSAYLVSYPSLMLTSDMVPISLPCLSFVYLQCCICLLCHIPAMFVCRSAYLGVRLVMSVFRLSVVPGSYRVSLSVLSSLSVVFCSPFVSCLFLVSIVYLPVLYCHVCLPIMSHLFAISFISYQSCLSDCCIIYMMCVSCVVPVCLLSPLLVTVVCVVPCLFLVLSVSPVN